MSISSVSLKRSLQDSEEFFKEIKKQKPIANPCLFLTEIIKNIFYFSSERDLAHASRVCNNWRFVIDNDQTLRLKKLNLYNYCFGKEKWKEFFGDIGLEPPLPKNIHETINNSCCFWPTKKIRETHVLMIIPQKISGKPFNLNFLSEIIKNPQKGYKAQYIFYENQFKEKYGEENIVNSYWVLITKTVIPKSEKTFNIQKIFFEKTIKKSEISYRVPTVLETATFILTNYISSGELIYGSSESVNYGEVYTRCQETLDGHPVAIGGFPPNGLNVACDWDHFSLFGVRAIANI